MKTEVHEVIIGGRTAAEITRMAIAKGWIKPPEEKPVGRSPEEIQQSREHRKKYRAVWMRNDRAEIRKACLERKKATFVMIRTGRFVVRQIPGDHFQIRS